jgi:hypothetical protein
VDFGSLVRTAPRRAKHLPGIRAYKRHDLSQRHQHRVAASTGGIIFSRAAPLRLRLLDWGGRDATEVGEVHTHGSPHLLHRVHWYLPAPLARTSGPICNILAGALYNQCWMLGNPIDQPLCVEHKPLVVHGGAVRSVGLHGQPASRRHVLMRCSRHTGCQGWWVQHTLYSRWRVRHRAAYHDDGHTHRQDVCTLGNRTAVFAHPACDHVQAVHSRHAACSPSSMRPGSAGPTAAPRQAADVAAATRCPPGLCRAWAKP